ncbi:MAG: bifunctional 23S rRNA (guanine(2069)-N(7))-methyltransferase RlmK/23S rRNA (guanine(2445)-N(2))-methyltransferase RlmL [Desulfuromonadales bacterium]
MHSTTTFFATAPKGLEALLADELRGLGAQEVKETRAGVSFSGSLAVGYRACLWSRLASRILLTLANFTATTYEELYAGVQAIDWREHLGEEGSLAVDCNCVQSPLQHSHYAALKVKDAIVDQLRDRRGQRPSVELERPSIRVNVHVQREQVSLSLDLSGESLHRRGYRQEQVLAPVKENLAAAILLRANWPQVAAAGGALVDPMCGSGTLVLEAALMAADIAPGLSRPYFGFLGWQGHDDAVWQDLLGEAAARRQAGLQTLPPLFGFDVESQAVRAAQANARQAGLESAVVFEKREVADLVAPTGTEGKGGLVLTNPPYGERLGEVNQLRTLYAQLGERLKEHFVGWKAAVFTGNPDLARNLGLRARRKHSFFNGALPCQLLHFEVDPQWFYGADVSEETRHAARTPGAEMFANRLKKNLRTLGRWARQNDIFCYRLYDADMPEYAVAVDLYGDWVHVQEYAPPTTVDARQAAIRLREIRAVLPEVLQLPPEQIVFKVRQKQKGSTQYEKLARRGELLKVGESGCSFLVNLTDYLDTGLFLDHRLTRQLIAEQAAGKTFLNLFAYTGSATVYAAKGGASATTTVDMSRTYLDWAQKNMAVNGFTGSRHEFIQADCLKWLRQEKRRFDLVFLDPPTFSNSKSMTDSFDVQRDHVPLLRDTARLLSPGGVLIFSNNNRKFKMEAAALPELQVEEITAKTIPRDFERNRRIHNCWKIQKK